MKRFLAPFVLGGAVACLTLSGCSEESKVKETETVSGPGGTTTSTVEKKVKSSGENPPANSAGQTGSDATPPK